MKLSEKQQVFTQDVARLILWVAEQGWGVTLGECYRTVDQQRRYVDQGKSQTMRSKHLERLAVDLNLFVAGKYQQSVEAYRPLGDYWKSLDPARNKWGGDWETLRDAVHFEQA